MHIPLEGRELKKKADQIRDSVLEVSLRNKAGHIAPSLSCIDILVALYYNVMSYRQKDPYWQDRDRLVFSKGHGCYGLYAILADKKIMPLQQWQDFYTEASTLSGCAERRPEFGLEASCGSLGHGLPIATGIALGAKLQAKKHRIFCVIGDGEMQEGTTWEALQFAVKYELDNLYIIIDTNRLQAMDFIINVLDKQAQDLNKRLGGFGLSPVICPGHDVNRLAETINLLKSTPENKPKIVIAETTKGFGLKCMENVAKFHFRIPTPEELSQGKSYE